MKDKYLVCECGEIYNTDTEKYMKQSLNKAGYMQISLQLKCGKLKTYLVHRIVAEAYCFRNPFLDMCQVNHIDGNKLNNASVNLEWSTRHHNMQHAYQNALLPNQVGEHNAFAKITDQDALEICRLISRYYNNSEISDILNISIDIIRTVREYRAWTHISKDFKMHPIKALNVNDIDIEIRRGVLDLAEHIDCKYEIARRLNIGRRAVEVIRKNM